MPSGNDKDSNIPHSKAKRRSRKKRKTNEAAIKTNGEEAPSGGQDENQPSPADTEVEGKSVSEELTPLLAAAGEGAVLKERNQQPNSRDSNPKLLKQQNLDIEDTLKEKQRHIDADPDKVLLLSDDACEKDVEFDLPPAEDVEPFLAAEANPQDLQVNVTAGRKGAPADDINQDDTGDPENAGRPDENVDAKEKESEDPKGVGNGEKSNDASQHPGDLDEVETVREIIGQVYQVSHEDVIIKCPPDNPAGSSGKDNLAKNELNQEDQEDRQTCGENKDVGQITVESAENSMVQETSHLLPEIPTAVIMAKISAGQTDGQLEKGMSF